jgi:transposase-like protein
MAVLREADACKQPGEVGALLRREGLYSSHLSEWRKQRDQGMLNTRRGRRPTSRAKAEVARLSREDGDRSPGKSLGALEGDVSREAQRRCPGDEG